MNGTILVTLTLSLALVAPVFAAEQGTASGTETGTAAAVTATAPTSQTSSESEPTEKEMREAVQRSLDSLNSQMRPPAAPSSTSSAARPYTYYSPYWRYYHSYWAGYKNSQESNYENWTDVAKRAHNTAKVEITSFKKIKCTPDEGGFLGEYVAELELRGAANPAAQEILQTSGKRLKGFFFKGDKGWIFGEAPSETK